MLDGLDLVPLDALTAQQLGLAVLDANENAAVSLNADNQFLVTQFLKRIVTTLQQCQHLLGQV